MNVLSCYLILLFNFIHYFILLHYVFYYQSHLGYFAFLFMES